MASLALGYAAGARRRTQSDRVDWKVSPTVKSVGPYRFFFYANERGEPPHIHVRRDRSVAKFWLDPVALSRSKRLSAEELTRIEAIVREHEDELMEAWRGFFSD